MPANLRPRFHGPPEDHNYSHRQTGDQSYNEHLMPYVHMGFHQYGLRLLGYSTRYTQGSSDEEGEKKVEEKPKTQKREAKSEDQGNEKNENAPPPKKRKKRRQPACYDFGMPKRKKRRSVIPSTTPVKTPGCLAWDPLTSNASLGSADQMCSTNNSDFSNSMSTECQDWPVTCTSCCPSWRSFRRKKPKSNGGEPHRVSQRLVIKNYKLPFEDLPTECKLHIFQYLTPQERGRAACVCSEWCSLMSCSSLWSHLDISDFDPFGGINVTSKAGQPVVKQPVLSPTKYASYKDQVCQFLAYLSTVEPSLQSLQFSFDIGHPKDEWMKAILDLLQKSKCHNLAYLKINWACTPIRPATEKYCCIYNKLRTLYRRHYQRATQFHVLLDQITKCAPNIETLSMPFDWLPRSVLLLSRLQNLRHLHLLQYMTLKGVSQELIDVAFASLPLLTHLEMQVCMPLHSSTHTFRLSHPHIQSLDISHSKGFYLRQVDLPQLNMLKVANNTWRGPLVDNADLKPPCLYTILCQGAPNLVVINKHKLFGYWQEFLYEELAAHLYRACPCKTHTQVPTQP